MIYTVTYNPSLDYYVKVNNLKTGIVNRSVSENITLGGKGINVSLALKELGVPTTALGFVGGFTGKVIHDKISQSGIPCHFIEVEGLSRINVKIKSTNETDVNGMGAHVQQKDVNKLISQLKKLLKPDDYLVICGSVPANLNEHAYCDLLKKLKHVKGVNLIVDACGKLLTNTLKFKPFLIKPNVHELCEIFNLTSVPDTNGAILYAEKLQKMGAKNVIVSLGSQGAIIVTENGKSSFVKALKGQVVNSVGAGDSMVAGFIYEFLQTSDCVSALKYGVASGTACAFTSGIATKEQIEYVKEHM